ncbi:MAG: T9SS type A sorting domain-containing protein [Bacteroidota bacterium]|nr:T9SS type A sorting domain-containing protein [Bacteroidota bacterium]
MRKFYFNEIYTCRESGLKITASWEIFLGELLGAAVFCSSAKSLNFKKRSRKIFFGEKNTPANIYQLIQCFMKSLKIIAVHAIIFALLSITAGSSFCQTLTPKYITTTPLSNGYYEYLPQGYNPVGTQTYPLLLCFGGYGENGDGSPAQLPYVISVHGATGWQITQGIFPNSFTVNGQNYKFIVLFPQFTGVATPQSINDFIDYAISHYRVDAIRIYMTGLSLGGGLVWDYTGNNVTYANRIAAMVPVCGGSYGDTLKAETIAAGNIAVWATHNDGDPTVPVDTTTNLYIKLINAASSPPNPLAKKTIFHDNQHNAWDSTYSFTAPLDAAEGLNVYQWMLQYKRGPGTLGATGLDFSISKKNSGAVFLQWKTSFENNNKGFQIQRSNNGTTFDSIGYLKTVSFAGKGADYSYTDALPNNGKNYYRLEQIDFYNNISYSPVKVIETNKANSFTIFPNPVGNELNIKLSVALLHGQLKIWNADGQLVAHTVINGNNNISIPVKQLSKGIYTVEIFDEGFSSKSNFVKQ